MTAFATERTDVLVVGAGPSGLSAATELKRRGVASVTLVEREPEAGGVPRHCGHSPFGMREFGRVLGGASYARRLTARALEAGVELRLGTSVVSITCGYEIILTVCDDAGARRIMARRVVLATGVRETPRAARLVPGDRPLGVMNTGALQASATLQRLAPFRRPVVVGAELVALSCLLTCRSIGARPAAIVESQARPTVFAPFMALPRLLGVPVRYGATIVDIAGRPRVERVTFMLADGSTETIACDGVVFTGQFTPEASLARAADLALDPATGRISTDASGRSSDPRVFVSGIVDRNVETAGWCWSRGRAVGKAVAADLAGSPSVRED